MSETTCRAVQLSGSDFSPRSVRHLIVKEPLLTQGVTPACGIEQMRAGGGNGIAAAQAQTGDAS